MLWEEDILRRPDGRLAGEAGDALKTAVPRQDAEFFAAVASGGVPPVSGHDVRPTMVVLQAVQDLLDARMRSAAA